MHQSLENLPVRVVLDTNVLLNACFVSDSSSAYAVAQLPRLGFSPVIDQAIEDEVNKVLRKLRIKHALGFNPVDLFQVYLRDAKILSLPQAHVYRSRKINNADLHVYSAAMHYRAWVLTADIHFAVQSQSLGASVRLPWDVIMEAATKDKRDPPPHYIFQYSGVSLLQGFLFARVIPGGWGGMRDVGRFTVCEVQHVARLLYDSNQQVWEFITASGFVVQAKCHVGKGEHWAVCGSYDLSVYSGRGTATLRACNADGQSTHSNVDIRNMFTSPSPGTVSFGHTVASTDYWNGHVRKIVIGPQSVNGKTWSALRQIPESAPDPSSSNVLEAALCRVRFSNGLAVMPTVSELRESWF